jgi:hypothetical protein
MQLFSSNQSILIKLNRGWLVLLLGALIFSGGCAGPDSSVRQGADNFATAFFVAPDGDDTGPGTRDAPFASLARARDAVRALGPEARGDILVEAAPGDYILEEPLRLDHRDSGRNGFRVVYRAGGKPGSARLLGGSRITDWEPVNGRTFRAKVDPEQVYHTLYENGVRAHRARFPNHEFHPNFPLSESRYLRSVDGTDSTLTWRKGDLDELQAFDLVKQGVFLVFRPWGFADWALFTRPIEDLDFDRRTITVGGGRNPDIRRGARFYIEGSIDLLDQPGEFHLDRENGYLYYWPRFGHPSEQHIMVPSLLRIVELIGPENTRPVRNITLEGFTFACTGTFDSMTGPSHMVWEAPNEFGATGDGAHGALHMYHTENIQIRFNSFQDLGACAIYLERSNKRNLIYGNWLHNVRISGIVLAAHRERNTFPEDLNEDNRIENNVIQFIGVNAGAGISLWGGRRNEILHCEVFDGSRHGISIRGNFGQLNPSAVERGIPDTRRPRAEENRVAYSHVYRMGQDSGDLGAVHMAGISGQTLHPVNYLEQLLIENAPSHPSMLDIPPNGIFFDYTEGVVGQVLRDIEIRGPGTPFRTNRTDFGHVYENVSWREDFDPSRMAYDRIGRLGDFPSHFGAPEEVREPVVRSTGDGAERRLHLTWSPPNDDRYAGVWIRAEGELEYAPVFVSAPDRSVTIPRPRADRLVELRLRAVDGYGNLSNGVLVAGAEPAQPVRNLQAQGMGEGIELTWENPQAEFSHLLVHSESIAEPIRVSSGRESLQIDGLSNGEVYSFRVDVVDRDGHAWPGPDIRVAAGPGTSIPLDVAAWWLLDVETAQAGLSVIDESGGGHTLFIGNDEVSAVEGRFGRALHFDGQSGFARALDASSLEVGLSDFAISLWIKRYPSPAMSGRLIDFGGGLLGAWEHWGRELESTTAGGVSLIGSDSGLRAVFFDGTEHYRAEREGLELLGRWTHVVLNLERKNELALWIDGLRVAAVDVSMAAGTKVRHEDTLWLGRYGPEAHPNLFWSGALDQIRIYRRSLSPSEIQALAREPVR